jgi:CRISPR/Cas system CSM-associated protein Csm2 small subunit
MTRDQVATAVSTARENRRRAELFIELTEVLEEVLEYMTDDWPDEDQMETMAPDTFALCANIRELLDKCGGM